MKAFYNIGRIAFWSVLMTLCLACSDGDDSNGGGSGGQDKKRLSTVNYSYMYEDGRVENAKKSIYTMTRGVFQFGNIILGTVMATGTI